LGNEGKDLVGKVVEVLKVRKVNIEQPMSDAE